LKSASKPVTCPIIYIEDKHIEKIMVVSMRCEIILEEVILKVPIKAEFHSRNEYMRC
jgi:hypothetical protein